MKLVPILLLAAAATAQAATDADLSRCRGVVDDKARLACYDALVAAPSPVVAPPVAAVAAPVPAAAPAPEFGFEARVFEKAPEALESRILGAFEGWEPNSRFRLENGQVWQVTDGSRGVGSGRDLKVKVTRAAFGTFFLEIEGRRAAPRVRRIE